ncbi:unnamed protein product [Rotaria sordida]|uniref:VPS9 domain-containing protein n=1 Tax=Rotaria sordida TaxID=392033 RepID=A0A813TRG9_9BILA|nr:unnamed protein product [Rotaria sordida]CAF0817051.1 unnamed protein product [Rotaria sordida]CAF3936356.1 unnamed protein product [Rotaria sordida]
MASSDTPELEDLPFYQLLTSNFNDLYLKAQEACSIIVIPQHLLNNSTLTRDIFESHLFRPSPCYLRKHVSWNDKYEIEFDNNRTIRFFYKKGGAGEKHVKILSQEDVRDSIRKRSYSILIIEQPLIDINGIKTSQNGSLGKTINKPFTPPAPKFNGATASYEASFMFLDSVRQIEPAFARLRTALFLFNETYVILPKYVENALDKLRQLRSQFLQESYQLLNKNCEDRDIELASEIYITGNTYTKVWPIIIQHNENKDQILVENIQKRQKKEQQNSNQTNLKINQNALNELKKLDDLKSAYEKAKCIRSALDLTMAAKTLMVVDPKNSAVSYRSSSNAMPMAADETLTAFIDLICELISTSEINTSICLVAHEYYTEKFRFSSLPQDIDYAFTTYRGVIEYLINSSSWF